MRRAATDIDRRAALKLLSGGLALSLASCGKPREEIVPYVDMPERLVSGETLKFATTLPLSGFGRGALVSSVDGRPIKIEGNPRHPASLGATDVFAQADLMGLYDPSRSKAPRHGDDIATWDAFAGALQRQMQKESERNGAKLCIVSGRVTSPTLLRQIGNLLTKYPQARWYAYEPLSEDAAYDGSVLAYGKRLTVLPRIADAAVVLALDADPFGPGPRQAAQAHAFAQNRMRQSQKFSRIYAVGPDWSLTGASADHRLALHPQLFGNFALAVAAALEGGEDPALPADAGHFARLCAADLKANSGHALVLAGPRLRPEMHALVHWLNERLDAPVQFIEPVDGNSRSDAQCLRALADDLDNNKVETLIIVDANPAYDTAPDLDLARKIKAAAFTVHLGLYDDETASLCHWHLPLSHSLESWSDLRAYDGTAGIVQPLIGPLYDSRAAHDLLALAAGDVSPSAYELVRQTWRAHATGVPFEVWWKQVLHDGVVGGSASATLQPGAARRPDLKPAAGPIELTLLFAADPSTFDGRFANNAWLQECPHPFTKDVWGNAIHLSSRDAGRLGIVGGDIVEIAHAKGTISGPIRVVEGQAEGVVAVSLGHGRTRAGAIGNGIGVDAYALRSLDAPWFVEAVTLNRTGRHRPPPATQSQFRLDGEDKELYPVMTLAELAGGKHPGDRQEDQPTLLPEFRYDSYAWAMVIDTSICIGCNACVVACQAENNVPVVGPEESSRGRDMHWLRVDRYTPDQGQPPGFQPVPCMHCEHAPCEPVCPVAASVHDGEGLNVQVYNRCIGTRFCQANCPYKVRRFNWFGYADGQEYADLGADAAKAARNPDVSVRSRGVMEKCTYCIQRISRARREAEKEHRRIGEGEVVTACQAACPTRAISFGDKNDKSARVNALRGEPHHYVLLGHLGTRPRTTYLARLRNPNKALQEISS